jgi:hypothetical protein
LAEALAIEDQVAPMDYPAFLRVKGAISGLYLKAETTEKANSIVNGMIAFTERKFSEDNVETVIALREFVHVFKGS